MEDAVKRNGEEENGECGSYDVIDGDDEDQQDLVAAYQKVLDMGDDIAPLNVMQTLDDIHEEDEEQQENTSEASEQTASANRLKAATLKDSEPSSLSETQPDRHIPGGDLQSEKHVEKSEKDVLEPQEELMSDTGSVSHPIGKPTLAQPKFDLRKLVERATSIYVDHFDERFTKNAAAAGYHVDNQTVLQNCTVTIDSEKRPTPETCRFEELQSAHIEPDKGASQRLILCRVSSLCDPDWLVSRTLHRFQQVANASSDCQTVLCPIVLNYGQLMARIGGGSFSSSAHVTTLVTRLLRTVLCPATSEGEQKQLTEDEFDFLVKNVLSVCAFLQANPLPKLQANVQLLPLVILEDVRCSYLDELHPIWTAVNEFQNATILLLAYDYLLLDKQHECDTKRFTDFWYVRPQSSGQSSQLAKQHPDCCFPAVLCASQKFNVDTLFALLERVLTEQLNIVAQSAQLDVALLCDILCHVCFAMLANPTKQFSEQVLIAELLRASENEQQVKQYVQALIQADILHPSGDDREEMLELFVTPFRTYFSSAAWQQFCVARHLLRRFTAERAKNTTGIVDFDIVLRGSEQLVTVRTPVISCDSLALFLQALLSEEKQPIEQFAQFVAKRGAGGRYVSSMRQFESNVLRTMFLNAVRFVFDASLDEQVRTKLTEQLLTVFSLKVNADGGETLLLNLADLIELSARTLSESLFKAVMQQLSGIKLAVRSCTSDHETKWLVDMIGLLQENCKLVSIDVSSWRTKALKTNSDLLFTCLLEKASKLEQFDLCLDHAFLRSYGDAFEQEARAQIAKRALQNENAGESDANLQQQQEAAVPSVELNKFTTNSNIRRFQLNIRHRVAQGDALNCRTGPRNSNLAVFLERICRTVLDEQSQVHSVSLRGCLMHRDVAKVLTRHVSAVKSLETLSICGPIELTTTSINAVDACSGGCTEMGGVSAFSEMLKTCQCRKVVLDLNTYGSPGVSNSNGSADYEILMASVLKALQRNEHVKDLQFRSRIIPHSVLETLADTIERCIALETVIIETEKMYDLLVENLANAVICQTTLRSLKLISTRFEAFSPNALMTFIQACVFSPELKLVEVRLDEGHASTPLSGFAVRLIEAALRSAEQFAITSSEAGQTERLSEPSNNTEQESNAVDVDSEKNVTEDVANDENKKSAEGEQEQSDAEEENLVVRDAQIRSADSPLVIRFAGILLTDTTKLGKRKPEEAIEQLKQNAAKLGHSSVRVELDELRM